MGMRVEMEHTDDKYIALEIVLDHLAEFPDYYTRLLKMEKEAEKSLKKNPNVSHLWQTYSSLVGSYFYIESPKAPFHNVKIWEAPDGFIVFWGDGYKTKGQKFFSTLKESKKFGEDKFNELISPIIKSNPKEKNSEVYLFCYGSNNKERLEDRLEREIDETYPAYAENYQRIFRGYSNKWQGGVASIQAKKEKNVYGLVVKITKKDLDKLDVFEGYPTSYTRKNIDVEVNLGNGFKTVSCVCYFAVSKEFNGPSKEYLKAIVNTISEHWTDNNRKIKISDIAIN
jgi:gamma-glutamylcyclotransferase (GGCT)/AIG2-like uncharacterized protein YtfP